MPRIVLKFAGVEWEIVPLLFHHIVMSRLMVLC